MGFDWTLANTAARDWANRYVGELIGGIQETTRAQVRQAVAAWVDNGQPLEALIRELEPTFGRPRRVDRQHRGDSGICGGHAGGIPRGRGD